MRWIENEARLANKYVKDSVVVDPHPKKMAVVWIGFLKKTKSNNKGDDQTYHHQQNHD